MKKLYIILLIIFGVIALIITGVVISLTSSKDLGVTYTKADLTSVNTKLGITYGVLPSSEDSRSSLKISGTKVLNQQITQAELTALLNQPSEQWKNYPVSDIQIKINSDGSVEMSGKILVDRFNEYSEATNMPAKYKDMIADKAGLVPVNPSFYYKGNYAITNGELEGDLTELKVGPLELPKNWADNNKNFINEFVEDRLNSAGMKVDSATFTNGKLDIKGTIPESIDFEK